MSMYEMLSNLNLGTHGQVLRHCMRIMSENYFICLGEDVSDLGVYNLRYRFFKEGSRGEEILVNLSILGNSPVILTVDDLTAGTSKSYVINQGNSVIHTLSFFDSFIEQLRATYGVQYLPGYEQGGELTALNFRHAICTTMQIILPASKYVDATTLTIEQLLEDFTREYCKGVSFFDFGIIFNAGSVLNFRALGKASELQIDSGYVVANEFMVVHGTGVDLLVPGTEITIYILLPDFENDTDSDLFKQ